MATTSRSALSAPHAPLLPALSSGASRCLQCRPAFPRRPSLPPYRMVAQKPPDFNKEKDSLHEHLQKTMTECSDVQGMDLMAAETYTHAMTLRQKLSEKRSYLIIMLSSNPFCMHISLGMAVKTARDALEAGTKLVPESVPRPVAQAGVALLGIVGGLYLLQSLFSIALFIVAIGVVGYYLFFFMNKDDDERGGGGPSGGSDTDLTLEEARRIMEKYK